jgi:hypothetical protein
MPVSLFVSLRLSASAFFVPAFQDLYSPWRLCGFSAGVKQYFQ